MQKFSFPLFAYKYTFCVVILNVSLAVLFSTERNLVYSGALLL